MIICVAGDIHGAMDRLYQDVLAFEASLGIRFDYLLQVGDFGVWPDPSRVDKATRRHDGAGDFPAWLRDNRRAPRPTLFIKGNHEDFVWLDSRPDLEVLSGFQTHMPAVAEAGETKQLVRRSVGAPLATHIFRGYN
jgi:hypothetical protein